jgi:hypothetical protein
VDPAPHRQAHRTILLWFTFRPSRRSRAQALEFIRDQRDTRVGTSDARREIQFRADGREHEAVLRVHRLREGNKPRCGRGQRQFATIRSEYTKSTHRKLRAPASRAWPHPPYRMPARRSAAAPPRARRLRRRTESRHKPFLRGTPHGVVTSQRLLNGFQLGARMTMCRKTFLNYCLRTPAQLRACHTGVSKTRPRKTRDGGLTSASLARFGPADKCTPPRTHCPAVKDPKRSWT